MTIRITHQAGVGEWANGAVVVCDDRRARRLILVGYAEAVADDPEPIVKKKKQAKE